MNAPLQPIRLTAVDETAPAFQSARTNLTGLRTDAQQAAAALGSSTQPVQKLGLSAAQTAAAMRQVPAQVQDIVVSLQAGQQPLTVLLQQGSQLSTVFGGTGAAVKAVGSYVAGLVNPFTLAAAAATALGVAYYQGSREADGYNKALALSGNISGTTASQLQDMARAMAEGTRTQSESAAALAEMATISQVGASHLQRYTAVAMDWGRVTGDAVSKTAQAFRELEQDPLKASLKLNEGLHYLTGTTYEHIKSLEEQGRRVEAARVAQEAYADSLAARTRQVTENLGYIESGWRAVTGAAKTAWDTMLNVGRKDSLGEQLDGARKQLDQRVQRGPLNDMPWARSAWEKGNETLRQQISLLTEQERMLKRGAEAQATAARQVEAKAKWDQEGARFLSKQVQMERDITRARNEGKEAGVAQAEIEQRVGAIRAQYADKGAASKARSAALKAERAEAKLLADDLSNLAQAAGLSPTFYKEWGQLEGMFKRGKLSVDELTQAQAKLLEKQPAIRTEAEAQKRAVDELNMARARFMTDQSRYLQGLDDETRGLRDQNGQMADEIARLGMSTSALAAHERARIGVAIAKKEERLATIELFDASSEEAQLMRDQIALLRQHQQLVGQRAEKEQLLEAQRAQLDMWKSIDQTAHDVFVNIFEDGAGTFKRLGQTLKAAVLDMLYQMTVKRWIIQIGASFTGQPVDVVSQALGGGQGGIGGMLSNGNSLLNLFTGNSGGIGSLLFGSSAAYGLGVPGVSLGSQQAAMLAAQTGQFGWGGLTSTASAANISGASWMSSAAAGLAVVAAPLIIGALAESRTRDRFSGAAFATSNFGKDPTITIGGAEYDPIKGILPDREALVGRALEAGISQDMIDRFKDKDRALLHYIRMLDANRQSGNEGPPINVNALLEGDNMYAADWYRGQGYAHPQAMGWWNDKGYDLASNDPAITSASRAVATSIVAPLTEINRILGGAADEFRVTAGYATRGDGKGVWAGLNVSQGENSLVDWVNKDDFHSPQEAVKGMYEQALGALEKLDLPGWAQKQVDGAQAAMAGIKGEKMGEEAAALYAQTAGSIAQTISAIKMLIDVFPDFAGQTQDTVHAIATAMGGLRNLTTAYNSYLEGFYSEEERRALAMKQLGAQFADLGVALPDSRDAFRALVESQDLSTEAGQRMFAALMGLAGAFAAVTPAAESAADAAGRLADEARRLADEAYSNARSRTDDVWARLQQLFNDQIDNWQKLADEARAIFDIATDAARQLRGEVADTRAWDAMQGRDFIAQALAGLRGTGALPDSDALSRAIESARGGLSMDGYATAAEYEFDQLVLAGQLKEIGDISGTQASFAEQQVDLLKEQMDQWRKQLDVLRGMDVNITTIAEGITVLADAMRAEQAAKAAIEAAQKPTTGGGGGRGVFGGGGGGPGRTPGQIADEAEALRGKDWWGKGDWHRLLGYRLDAAAKATGISPDDLAKYLAKRGMDTRGGIIMPKFDVGTNYVPRDMVAQIHEGERIIPAADNARLMALLANASQGGQNDALVAEVKALRAEVTALRAERTAADVPMHRMAWQFANVTAGGNAMMTETA